MTIKAAFRVDSSIEMGSGHVMRCLTLADALRTQGAEVCFICREWPGYLGDVIRGKGFEVRVLPRPPARRSKKKTFRYSDWLGVSLRLDSRQTRAALEGWGADLLVVDHYAINLSWEKELRSVVRKIFVIDDLADRPHDCDILVDQNLFDRPTNRYRGLVPSHAKLFMGPQYAFLRSDFIAHRKSFRPKKGEIKNILIFFGGTDPMDLTSKAVVALRRIQSPSFRVAVVVGMSNPHRFKVKRIVERERKMSFYCQTPKMAELMSRADLLLGGGGTATWERCCVGLPALTIVMAPNQALLASTMHDRGTCWNLGDYKQVDDERIEQKVRVALQRPDDIKIMSRKAFALMAGVEKAIPILFQAISAETYVSA